jgi:hypothetical protein
MAEPVDPERGQARFDFDPQTAPEHGDLRRRLQHFRCIDWHTYGAAVIRRIETAAWARFRPLAPKCSERSGPMQTGCAQSANLRNVAMT